MPLTLVILSLLLSISFLLYGYNCLFTAKMISEFNRFQLTPWQRQLTGILQIVGAIGILIGFYLPFIGFLATLGLSILMFLGFGVRLKIKDSFAQSFPSFLMFVLNIWASCLYYHYYMQS